MKFLRCPFCGSDNVVQKKKSLHATCQNCQSKGPSSLSPQYSWNGRSGTAILVFLNSLPEASRKDLLKQIGYEKPELFMPNAEILKKLICAPSTNVEGKQKEKNLEQ